MGVLNEKRCKTFLELKCSDEYVGGVCCCAVFIYLVIIFYDSKKNKS